MEDAVKVFSICRCSACLDFGRAVDQATAAGADIMEDPAVELTWAQLREDCPAYRIVEGR